MKTTKTKTMTATVLAAKGAGGCRKGPWTEQEDMKLIWFVRLFSERRWDLLAKVSGLNRTGKSCRLRWVNYLHPNLKRGRMSPDEERLVIDLHAKWGNRWSHIAKSMPGRTDNEIKNYWRTHTRKTTRAAADSASASACTTTSMSMSASSSSFNSSSDHTHHGEEENEGDQLLYTAGVSTMDGHLLWNDVIVDTYACWSGGMGGSALPSVMVAPSSPVWDYCCPDSLWG